MDKIPLPNELYELKIFFWIISIIIFVLGAVSLWFLIRMVINQDTLNKEIRSEVKNNKEDIDILKNDLFEMTKLLNGDIRSIKKDVDEFEKTLRDMKAKSDQSFAYLVKINDDLNSIKEAVDRHEDVIYNVKTQLQQCDRFKPS